LSITNILDYFYYQITNNCFIFGDCFIDLVRFIAMEKKEFYKYLVDLSIAALIVLLATVLIFNYHSFFHSADVSSDLLEEEIEKPKEKFGFPVEEYVFESAKVKPNQFLGNILYWEGISYAQIDELARKAKEVFDVRKIRSGLNYTLVRSDSCGELLSFVYEPSPFNYVVYDFRDSINVFKVEHEIETRVESAYGKVETSLWNSMIENGLSISLIDKMEDALAWSVDFYHAQKGDEYKVIYERKFIEGKPVSIGRLIGAFYENDQAHYAIYWDSKHYSGYYDQYGNPTKKAFLKAPVKFSRISSRFSYNRFHPILKRSRPHFGTDYAAPYGTPIHSVANGTVIARTYSKNNGYYVKIRHDNQYMTQYLHMQKFAEGIHKGSHVKQGQTIGYVGSTGLATGPHVCFRFTKNGRPIDHLRENFPPPEPLPQEELEKYLVVRDSIVPLIDQVGQDFTWVPSAFDPIDSLIP
jgi:murein DD-endopeptidase MepM/ murein hydrolase activator NlpD